MSKIYVPTAYKNNCNVVYDNYIRSYTNSDHATWVDIYFKNGSRLSIVGALDSDRGLRTHATLIDEVRKLYQNYRVILHKSYL